MGTTADFHKCGAYSFNHNAIEILDDDTANESGIDLNCSPDNGTSMSEDLHLDDILKSNSTISPNE